MRSIESSQTSHVNIEGFQVAGENMLRRVLGHAIFRFLAAFLQSQPARQRSSLVYRFHRSSCLFTAASTARRSESDNLPIILTKRSLLTVVNWSASAFAFLPSIITNTSLG